MVEYVGNGVTPMALNIKNREVEKLAAEVATLARESKTEAIRRALLDRKQRLVLHRGRASRYDRVMDLLRNRIWPQIPEEERGRPLTKQEKEEILGYGPEGF
jgi:antitoxin VapB